MTKQRGDLFTAIDHVGVAVNDLDAAISIVCLERPRAVAFYRDSYG